MIREVTYYQAQCDVCGAVDDGGEFSAWSEPDDARMTAVDAEWTEIEVPVPNDAESGEIYRYTPEGRTPYNVRSILLCRDHVGDGVFWCSTCEDDLDESQWALVEGEEAIMQVCSGGHENTIRLGGEQ